MYFSAMFARRFLLLLPLALSLSRAFGQEVDSTDYFPLQVGNSWTYYSLVERHDAPPDTGVGLPRVVDEMLSVSDTTYYRTPHPNSFADTLREDGEGRIWARSRRKDVLLYDFTLPEGETYTFDPGFIDPPSLFHVMIERGLAVDVAAGHFENCVGLYFDILEGADFGHTYIFAPNVGIVISYDGMGEGSFLFEAVVNGRVISSTEEEHPTSRREVNASVYPNPFTIGTTIIVPAQIGPAPTALVYDVLGRRVASLTARQYEAGRCEYKWDGSGLPRGQYFVATEDGRGVGVVHR